MYELQQKQKIAFEKEEENRELKMKIDLMENDKEGILQIIKARLQESLEGK